VRGIDLFCKAQSTLPIAVAFYCVFRIQQETAYERYFNQVLVMKTYKPAKLGLGSAANPATAAERLKTALLEVCVVCSTIGSCISHLQHNKAQDYQHHSAMPCMGTNANPTLV
jgi:hypothetical protein